MPGILGIISKKKFKDGRSALDRMIEILQHEGDYIVDRFSLNNGLYFAANMTVNASGMSHRHYSDTRTGNVCIVGGEIHNFDELKMELAQSKIGLENDNDAELALRLYEEHGENFLKKINGWFNLLIHKPADGTVLIANDRFGMMPLYFYKGYDRFIFAPEVKAILTDTCVRKNLRIQSVCEHMLFECILNDRTYFEDIYRLQPASMWIFRDGCWTTYQYWHWGEYRDLPQISHREFVEKSTEVFSRIIPRCFRRCTDAVISLTGGIDTRTIMAGMPSSSSISRSMTYGFHELVPDNVIAGKISNTFGIPHMFLNSSEILTMENIRKAIHISDGMCNIQAGFDISDSLRDAFKNRLVIKGIYGTQVLHATYRKNNSLLKNTWEKTGRLFSADIRRRYSYESSISGLPPDLLSNDLCLMIQEELRHYHYGYLAVQNSIQIVRTPYTDSDLVSLLFQAPDDLDIEGLQKGFIKRQDMRLARFPTDKGVLIQDDNFFWRILAYKYRSRHFLTRVAMARRIPAFLYLHKLPFIVVFHLGELMRGALKDDISQILSDKRTVGRGIFDMEQAKKLFMLHDRNIKDYSKEIGRLVVLELFFREFVD